MSLYNKTCAASAAVAKYRNPNLDEWRIAIDPVLKAAGEEAIAADRVESIDVTFGTVTINTSYVLCGCKNESSVSLPLSILMAGDPIHAANKFRLENALAVACRQVHEARHRLELSLENEKAITTQLAALLLHSPESDKVNQE